MANIITIQTLIDGPRNAVIKVEGLLDTADFAAQVIADPAALIGMDNTGTVKASKLRIVRMQYNVKDPLSMLLQWDATTPVRVEQVTARGTLHFDEFNGLVNNAGAGVTGKILLSSAGWAATTGGLPFSIVLDLVKQGT